MKNIKFVAAGSVLSLGCTLMAAAGHAAESSKDDARTLSPVVVSAPSEPSLTVPSVDYAKELIEQTPGAVDVISSEEWEDTQARTIKDVLDYTPGVFAQPKWGEDTRLSIRGSGLSRNFHMRGISLYQDGVPVNQADGSTDFQEIDPTAFRYTEVYKGGNGLRYGASTLGGAINFVTPTGHDADLFGARVDVGGFNDYRLQMNTGGVMGAWDGFLSASFLDRDGFRDHSGGESLRASGNIGLRLSDKTETRMYLKVADIHQDIPGSVTKEQALTDPKAAAAGNLKLHYRRDIKSYKLSNVTTMQVGEGTKVEVGGYASDKHLIHPIYQLLDYRYYDFGAFGRAVDERQIAGHDNRLTLGVTLSGGWVDNSQYTNVSGGTRGDLLSKSKDKSMNALLYAENAFDLRSDLTVVGGLQLVRAKRDRDDEFENATDTSGENTYTFLNPKLGLIWQVDPSWQVFGNVSRSGEAPTFSELNFTNTALSDTKAQRATTFEIGTRGDRETYTWDIAAYRSHIDNEFQYFDLGGGNYQVTNAHKTIHQGIEAGFGLAVAEGLVDTGKGKDSLWLKTAYTFSDFRFDGDQAWGDNELPGAPRHFIRAELMYKSPLGFNVGPNVEWVPEAYYVDNTNSFKSKGYAILGARAGYDLNDNVSFFIDARNLTNEKYISSASIAATASDTSALFEPGDGRSVFLGMKVRW